MLKRIPLNTPPSQISASVRNERLSGRSHPVQNVNVPVDLVITPVNSQPSPGSASKLQRGRYLPDAAKSVMNAWIQKHRDQRRRSRAQAKLMEETGQWNLQILKYIYNKRPRRQRLRAPGRRWCICRSITKENGRQGEN